LEARQNFHTISFFFNFERNRSAVKKIQISSQKNGPTFLAEILNRHWLFSRVSKTVTVLAAFDGHFSSSDKFLLS